ncbi:MAG TPA: lamin tail domain-containing protein [Symbiobacteriaceae bacterium]|nr:lamin tail domain-containing protein [Symbiobacteriaceae bacterium]
MLPAIVVAGIYHHTGSVTAPLAPDEEYVVLVNMGDRPVDMRGWSLTNRKQDQVDHYRYLFPRFLSTGDLWELEPGGLVLLYTGRGTNGATATTGEAHQFHLFQHRTQCVWADPGDTACLYDRSGKLVSEYELPDYGVRYQSDI